MQPAQTPARVTARSSALTSLLFAGLLVAGAPPATAQTTDQHGQHGQPGDQAPSTPQGSVGGQSALNPMMEMHRKMMAEDKAADAALGSLLEKMNAATGEPKVEAMAAVITELARQRTLWRRHMEHMSVMHGGMHAEKAAGPKCAGCSHMKGEGLPHSPKQ